MKKALVLGGGGFIGSHIVSRLAKEGFWVKAVDIKYPCFGKSDANHFMLGDLTLQDVVKNAIDQPYDEIYQLAADMGGAGYIFTGDNDANVMSNSALINLLVCKRAASIGCGSIFYSSSACIYPEHNQTDPANPKCSEGSAYPANPDSEYGWEKLFSERVYASYKRNYGLNVHIGRYHNIYGQQGTYQGGKEKAPAALCRKVIGCDDNGEIEIWGDGRQTRSFLFIDDCVDATLKLIRSDFAEPLNIGSEEMISINDFAKMIISISGKNIRVKNISGPVGVNGRNSDNKMIHKHLNWLPKTDLRSGMEKTYKWIEGQMAE